MQFCRIEEMSPPPTIVQPGRYAFLSDDRVHLSIRLLRPTPRRALKALIIDVLEGRAA